MGGPRTGRTSHLAREIQMPIITTGKCKGVRMPGGGRCWYEGELADGWCPEHFDLHSKGR